VKCKQPFLRLRQRLLYPRRRNDLQKEEAGQEWTFVGDNLEDRWYFLNGNVVQECRICWYYWAEVPGEERVDESW